MMFGEWLPDQPDTQNPGVTVADNVIPASMGYRHLNQFNAYSGSASDTIKGLFAAKDKDGTVELFAGDASRLYKFDSTDSGLDDVSQGTGYSLGTKDRWRFVQFGNEVIASGGTGVALQKWDLGSSTQFAVLSTDAPKADFIAVVRDFVWLANIDEGSGRVPYKVYWSGFNDTTSWTAGTEQSDFQEIPDAGAITGLVGGEYATVLMDKAIIRATYTGPPLIWQFDKVETSRGCQTPGSVCNIGHLVFFLSDDGFYAFDGQRATPIGAEKVNKFFFDDANLAQKSKMSAAVDPTNQIAVWSYVSNDSNDFTPDKLLIYNYALNRWSSASVNADLLAPFFSPDYTLEALDNITSSLDALPASLDSNFWLGGQFQFGGALGAKLYAFSGDPLSATIETTESVISPGNTTFIPRVYPYYKGGSVTMQIASRNNQSDTATFGSAVSPNTDGFCPFRANGRYHTLRMNISGTWEYAQGVDVEAREIGRR